MTNQVRIRLLSNCKHWKDEGASYPVEVIAAQACVSGDIIGYFVSDDALKKIGVFNQPGVPRYFAPHHCEAIE